MPRLLRTVSIGEEGELTLQSTRTPKVVRAYGALVPWSPVISNVRQHVFGRPFPLDPPESGQLDVWATVCVQLAVPFRDPEDPSHAPCVGYFRNFGIRLNGPQPRHFLEHIIDDGIVDWEDTEVTEVDLERLDQTIKECVSEPDKNGVWYKSGRMYFPEGDDAA